MVSTSPAVQAKAPPRHGSTLTPEAHALYCAACAEFIALRGTRLYPGVDRELPPFEFDATFPPIAGSGRDAGWERVPEEFTGPVELTLLGMRLRWVRVRPTPPREWNPLYDGEYVHRNAWGGDQMLSWVPGDDSWDRFRTY